MSCVTKLISYSFICLGDLNAGCQRTSIMVDGSQYTYFKKLTGVIGCFNPKIFFRVHLVHVFYAVMPAKKVKFHVWHNADS